MGGGPSSSKPKQGQESKKDQKQGSQQEKNQHSAKPEEKPGGEKNEPKNGEETRHDQVGEGPLPQGEEGDLKSRSGQGRWGFLPKTVIEQVYENGKRQLPARYRVLLEEYFRRLPKRVQND